MQRWGQQRVGDPVTAGQDHVVHGGSRSDTLVRRRLVEDGLTAPEEARFLELVAATVPVRVPRVVRVLSADAMEMERMAGAPLLSVPPEGLDLVERQRIAGQLGRFIGAMAGIDVARAEEWIPVDRPDLEEYRSEAAAVALDVRDALPRQVRPAVDRFLSRRCWLRPRELYVCHQDLGAEHVFVDQGAGYAITGIIDFSDAAVADPALDLGLLMRDLGSDAFGHALASFAVSGGDMEEVAPRALIYARCRTLEDLAFGLENNLIDYTDNALRAALDLFADVA